MVRKVLLPLVAAIMIVAMVIPGCAPTATYSLTMAVNPEGAGTTTPTTGTTSREEGALVSVTAAAAEGWEFVNWTAAPAVTFLDANAATTTFTMPAQAVTVTANFVGLRCTIIRDDYGVPHVYADTKADLAFGAGYAMARDRLWQADVFRRGASGRLAELGLATIEDDAEIRGLWYGQEELLAIYDEWDPGEGYEHLKPMVEAYVEGINLYIEEALAAWAVWDWSLVPVEYIASGLVSYLEPFTVADVVAVTVMMAWRFGGTGGNEGDLYEALLTLQAMHDPAPGYAIWSDLFPLNDAGAPVTIPDEVYEPSSTSVTLMDFPAGIEALSQQYEEAKAAQRELFHTLGIPTKFGSNAVPVSGNLSATGNTLQLGGPQMGHTVPQIVYEMGLHGDGINAVGMAMAGAGPFILIGVSESGAWTSTTGASDVMDIRVLELNPAPTDPEIPEYWFDGGWVEMEVRTETIYGLKKQTSEEWTFYRSHYGPIVAIDGLQAFTLHTPFYKNEMGAEQGWQLFQEATNIDEFEAAVELIWPSHNFVWSDTEGNIGYWHAGRFPVKPEGVGADCRLPLMGDGTQEWARVTDPEEMPRVINPEQGWLANWNNKPIANWPYAESDFHWGEGHRVQVLMNGMTLLAGVGDLTVDHMNLINQVGGYHHTAGMNFVADLIAAAGASGNSTLEEAGAYLEAWATAASLPIPIPIPVPSYVDLVSPMWPGDENPTYDHAGLTIFDAWYDRIIPEVFAGILPSELMAEVKGNPSLLIRILREDAGLLYGYPSGGTLDTMIVDALKEAVDALEIQYGSSDMSTWLTPVMMQNYTAQGALPGGPLHPRMNRGTYNHIAELRSGEGELPLAKSVIPPGQSGFVGLWLGVPAPSPHVADQVVLYAGWTYKDMLFTRVAVDAVKTWERDFFVE